MGRIYPILQLLHLGVAAIWIGGAVANDLVHRRLRGSADPAVRVALAGAGTAMARRLELHGAILMPLLGLAMLAVGPGLAIFRTGPWFHIKMTAALVLIVVALISVGRQARIAGLAEAGGAELERALSGYFGLRWIGLAAMLVILATVVPGLMQPL
jgi:hypothetical protein